ncbi:hypothetical protein EIN_186140 [Entamoeba invadens IP1]|uniref:hypothetical protein n=1 Tax=Entamoeba invadens IP1 TaxID=370355 RepID=UPI0002C3D99C|nr:hypothetical protein EIN_186140 [Entamoeba invadens IP1]ELP94197.1 hypothetical protein EIN_186140 [Entamoeba invadens IP1]|eukprot:XP_004260968.1 hypothetical protein EIN_186140 [Entamoeba invadens IP1]
MEQVLVDPQFNQQKALSFIKAFVSSLPEIHNVTKGKVYDILQSKTVSEFMVKWSPVMWTYLRDENVSEENKLRFMLYIAPLKNDSSKEGMLSLVRFSTEESVRLLTQIIERNSRIAVDDNYFIKLQKDEKLCKCFNEFMTQLNRMDKIQKTPVWKLVDPFYFADAEENKRIRKAALRSEIVSRLEFADQSTLQQIFKMNGGSSSNWDVTLHLDILEISQLKEILMVLG